MKFFKGLFCGHLRLTDNIFDMPDNTIYTQVGRKDWRLNESYWGCASCGRVFVKAFDFIPINFKEG